MKLNSLMLNLFTLTSLLLPFMSIADGSQSSLPQNYNKLTQNEKEQVATKISKQIAQDLKSESLEKQFSARRKLLYLASVYGMGLLYAALYVQVGLSPATKEILAIDEQLYPESAPSSQPLIDLGTHTLKLAKTGLTDLKNWYYSPKMELI